MFAEKNKYLALILLFFGIIFCLISLVNHYCFRTFALDLGLFSNALWDYAHFRKNEYSLLAHLFKNPLGDHFSLLTPLVSPLYWVFGSYTMPIIQIVAILFGAMGIYTYFRYKFNIGQLPYWATVQFLSMWGIYSALSYDFHDNVVAAMMVPWLLYFFEKGNWKLVAVFFILLLVSKENMAFWAVFISAGLLLLYFKDVAKRKVAIGMGAISATYFVIVLKLVIPYFSGGSEHYFHFKYAALGSDFGEAFKTVLTQPLYTIKLLFANHLDQSIADGIKIELHQMVFLSGGIALLYRPQFLIMLLPIYAQKLYSDDFMKWGINLQYSIEFAPILTIALFTMIGELSKDKWLKPLMISVTALTLFATIYKIDHRVSKWYQPDRVRIYQPAHYQQPFDIERAYEVMNLIPLEASLSAQSFLVPHTCFRKEIYQFPRNKDAVNYIFCIKSGSSYPLRKAELAEQLDILIRSGNWETIHDDGDIYLLKRKLN